MYIAVYLFTASVVSLQCKSPYIVFFYKKLEHFQLKLLEFCVSVGGFSQSDDTGFFWYRNILYAACIRGKLFRVCTFSWAKASKVHKN